MDDFSQVSAIVPAHNEAPRIKAVLDVLFPMNFGEVIVVDNASRDGTGEVASICGAQVIVSARRGKGYAMSDGVDAARYDTLFFCDADLLALSDAVVRQIVRPVVRGETELCIGERRSKMRSIRGISHSFFLDGQRACTRSLWNSVPRWCKNGYGIEAALNYYSRFSGGYRYVLCDITQVRKEEKGGQRRGLWKRVQMCIEVSMTWLLVRILKPEGLFRRIESEV